MFNMAGFGTLSDLKTRKASVSKWNRPAHESNITLHQGVNFPVGHFSTIHEFIVEQNNRNKLHDFLFGPNTKLFSRGTSLTLNQTEYVGLPLGLPTIRSVLTPTVDLRSLILKLNREQVLEVLKAKKQTKWRYKGFENSQRRTNQSGPSPGNQSLDWGTSDVDSGNKTINSSVTVWVEEQLTPLLTTQDIPIKHTTLKAEISNVRTSEHQNVDLTDIKPIIANATIDEFVMQIYSASSLTPYIGHSTTNSHAEEKESNSDDKTITARPTTSLKLSTDHESPLPQNKLKNILETQAGEPAHVNASNVQVLTAHDKVINGAISTKQESLLNQYAIKMPSEEPVHANASNVEVLAAHNNVTNVAINIEQGRPLQKHVANEHVKKQVQTVGLQVSTAQQSLNISSVNTNNNTTHVAHTEFSNDLRARDNLVHNKINLINNLTAYEGTKVTKELHSKMTEKRRRKLAGEIKEEKHNLTDGTPIVTIVTAVTIHGSISSAVTSVNNTSSDLSTAQLPKNTSPHMTSVTNTAPELLKLLVEPLATKAENDTFVDNPVTVRLLPTIMSGNNTSSTKPAVRELLNGSSLTTHSLFVKGARIRRLQKV